MQSVETRKEDAYGVHSRRSRGAMKAQAWDVYYGCKQGATESISSYQIRFEQAVQVLKEVGETVPSNVQQAHDFIRWLDRARFSQLQCSWKMK